MKLCPDAQRLKKFYEYRVWESIEVTGSVRLEILLDFLEPTCHDIILDHGCGSGSFTKSFAPKSHNVIGIDVSKNALILAKNYLLKETRAGKVHFVLGDVESLPFRSETFTKLVSSDVLEHIADVSKCVREMNRVLRKGGTAAVYTGCDANKFTAQWFMFKIFGYDVIGLPNGHINTTFFTTKYHKDLFLKWFQITQTRYYGHYLTWIITTIYKLVSRRFREFKVKDKQRIRKRLLYRFADQLIRIEQSVLKGIPIGTGIFMKIKKLPRQLK